jgi:type II secretory pathway component PulC
MKTAEETSQGKPKMPVSARQKVMTLLIPVLAVALVMLVRKPMRSPRAASAETPNSTAVTAEEAGVIQVDWTIPPVYQPSGKDPMRLTAPTYVVEETPVPPVEVRKHLVLRGVLYSTNKPAAIVDTHLVHEGEQVTGVTVIKIERDGVVFEANGERWKQTVSAPADPGDSDTKENRKQPTGPQGNDDETP